MRHISPSGLSCYRKDPTDFYLRYLSPNRPAKEGQTKAMALGSAFDAFVKSYLHTQLFGPSDDYELRRLFEMQVEAPRRDEAWKLGQQMFDQYKKLGALVDILNLLGSASAKPRFEINITNSIRAGEVVLNGRPDLFFISEQGVPVILDWKVNGYYSKSGHSPMPCYVKLRDGGFPKAHAKVIRDVFKGVVIAQGHDFESLALDWATQTTVYAWLCGQEIESQFVTQIHQLVCRPTGMRVAEYSSLISSGFQSKLYEELCALWEIAHSDHFFRDMTPEQSRERCLLLDQRALERNDIWGEFQS